MRARTTSRLPRSISAAVARGKCLDGMGAPGGAKVAGIIVHRLARRLWGALGQMGPHPEIVVRWTGKPGRAGGRARLLPRQFVTLRIGNHCDRAALMMVVLHELTHVALGPDVEAHGRAFNDLLVRTAEVVWRVVVPTTGLGYKPSRALESALRAMLARQGAANQTGAPGGAGRGVKSAAPPVREPVSAPAPAPAPDPERVSQWAQKLLESLAAKSASDQPIVPRRRRAGGGT